MPRRSPTFHDFIGQKEAVDRLRKLVAGAQARKMPFPHFLVRGSSGRGKTLLARAVATEFGTGFVEARGQLAREELVARYSKIKTHDFIFIDEAHLLNTQAQDLLLEIIDESTITLPSQKKADDNKDDGPSHIEIPPCTIVLATDRPGALCNALLKRMAVEIPIRLYRIDELKEIVEQVAKTLGVLISPQGARQIAQVSDGLPRKVRHHLETLRLFFPDSEDRQLGQQHVREYLDSFGVDENGLDEDHRQYMSYLRDVGAASLESLAEHLGTDPEFVRHQIEPILIQLRLIKIGRGGRQLTSMGKETGETNQNSPLEENDQDGDD